MQNHYDRLQQMDKDRNKDLDIIAKQVDTNCVNTTSKDTDSSDVTLLHITQQSAIMPLSMDFISSFSFSSEITKNVTMVLSRQSDQFRRDNTICGYLELFGLITCNEMRGVNYRQMVSKAAHKDLILVRWNDVR